MALAQMGMLGLGVMGQNLSLNLADHGFSVAGYDAWPAPVDKLLSVAKGKDVVGHKELPAFVASLARPRRIIMLVKAGDVVDQTIAALLPLLQPGDLLIDGGNEFFKNTERRALALADRGIRFFGMGVSGGEDGARHGPSLMPGGDPQGYEELAPVLTKIAAEADGACVTYVGPGASGHYVKMVHNGIEYGDMQLIAEAYDLLKSLAGLDNDALADHFEAWNRGELQSFLIEISARILRFADPEQPGTRLLDLIADRASMKGTGSWTVESAALLGVPVPTLASAVDARLLSSGLLERKLAQERLSGPTAEAHGSARAQSSDDTLTKDVRDALYAAKMCAYAQGLALLRRASSEYDWALNLSELARIWTGGCIIRAQFLGRIKEAYLRDPQLPNLLFDDSFAREIGERQLSLRRVVSRAMLAGIAVPAHASALAYYDSLRRARLPQNLTQAQRDYFGAHTYERIDRAGSFHSGWGNS
jgi:6-phosphogluconate dehydrogenase